MELHSSSNIDIRRINRGRILQLLSFHGAMSRAELCRQTGLTGAGLSRIARELIASGLLLEGDPVPRRGVAGRRSSFLSINPDGAYVLGLTIAANRISVVLTNAAKEQIARKEFERLDFRDPDLVLSTLADAANELVGDHKPDLGRLVGAGVSVSMPVAHLLEGAVTVSSGILGWRDVPVASFFEKALDLPVKVEARSAALLREEAAGASDAIEESRYLVNVGLGVGCALLSRGEILTVDGYGLGGLSHVAPPGSDFACDCGRKGCLQHTGSGAAVVRELLGPDQSGSRSFLELGSHLTKAIASASQGDDKARAAFHAAGLRMSAGIDMAQAMLHPDVIYLAGATGRQTDFVAGVKDGLRDLNSIEAAKRLQISAARSSAAAACIALNAFLLSPGLDLERLAAAGDG